MNRRNGILFVAVAVTAAIFAVAGYLLMIQKEISAHSSYSDYKRCVAMASDIQRLGQKPALASDREKVPSETTGVIERAAKGAGIPPERLVRIVPEPSQRLGDSAYKEKPTQVLLNNLTLQQIVSFLSNVAAAEGLNHKFIRISAPQADGSDNSWNVEATVTYLIYDPQKNDPK